MKPEPRFKVGDRVRLTGNRNAGTAFTITKVSDYHPHERLPASYEFYYVGDGAGYLGVWQQELELVVPAPQDGEQSGYQEYVSGGLSARGMGSREAHIRQIEDLQGVIRRRNQQIHADRAEIAELQKMLKESTVGSALNDLADRLGLTAEDASEALELGARARALGVYAEDISDLVKIKTRGLR